MHKDTHAHVARCIVPHRSEKRPALMTLLLWVEHVMDHHGTYVGAPLQETMLRMRTCTKATCVDHLACALSFKQQLDVSAAAELHHALQAARLSEPNLAAAARTRDPQLGPRHQVTLSVCVWGVSALQPLPHSVEVPRQKFSPP
eukprot:635528-Amphidinium_carterae.2